jgi:FdhD protein
VQPDSQKQFEIHRVESGRMTKMRDTLAVEEPLEIRVIYGPESDRKTRTLAVTMRTPGHDYELATGFLISEGVISESDSVIACRHVIPVSNRHPFSSVVEIELATHVRFELSKLQRNFYTTSSCGVCGKASLDAIREDNVKSVTANFTIPASMIGGLPAVLRRQQKLFAATGGIHAAGLVDRFGQWIEVREDVGRHNAVDKLIGSQYQAGKFPASERVLVLSGRASFELMQKALLASIPIVVAVGAPSSLAVELASEFGQTLIGFTSEKRFNVYCGESRVAVS